MYLVGVSEVLKLKWAKGQLVQLKLEMCFNGYRFLKGNDTFNTRWLLALIVANAIRVTRVKSVVFNVLAMMTPHFVMINLPNI